MLSLEENGQDVQTEDPAAVEGETKPEDVPDATEPKDPSVPKEPDDTGTTSPGVWTDGETTVTLDQAAADHLALSVEVTQSQILVTLTRRDDAAGLAETGPMSFHVLWKGLQGTFAFRMEPYGTAQTPEATAGEAERPQVVPDLDLFSACDIMDTQDPISVVKLNTETFADFTLRFSCESEPVFKVRYSLDGGATYTMLYETHLLTIGWPYPENWDGTVCLDFGQALEPAQRPTINVMATDYEVQEYSPVRYAVPKPADFVLLVEELPYNVTRNIGWGGTHLSRLTIERLTVSDGGVLVYAEDPTLVATVEKGVICLSSASETDLPAAGSYRMRLAWSWGGVLLKEHTVYFFVNTR